MLPSGGVLLEDMATRLVLVWLDTCHSRWPAKFMAAGHLFLRKIGRRLASACVSALCQRDMLAAAALQPVALRRVAPVFAAITLRWLHDDGDRALLDHDFGVWAQGLLVPGGTSSYNDFATVDACLLPPPAPQSLAGSGFLADSGPPRPAAHLADEWAFVKCLQHYEVHTASVTDEDDGGFTPVAPMNGQLVCGLCKDCTMDAHEGMDGQLVPHGVYLRGLPGRLSLALHPRPP